MIKMNLSCQKLLQEGKIKLYSQKMQSYFTLTGLVVHGEKIGTSIGFPTINLVFLTKTFLLKLGCYLTFVQVQKEYYFGLTCLLQKESGYINCETYLEKFNQIIYGQSVTVYFLSFFRENISLSLWKKNHLKMIANDLKQLQNKRIINKSWLSNYQKNVKIRG